MLVIVLALFGGWNLCDKPRSWNLAGESCYSLTCSCVDCSGAACKCGTAVKQKLEAVRVCGPGGCSVQMVPNHNVGNSHIYVPTNYPTFSESSSCQSGNCGTARRGLFGRRR